jgi:hypothetical protein
VPDTGTQLLEPGESMSGTIRFSLVDSADRMPK